MTGNKSKPFVYLAVSLLASFCFPVGAYAQQDVSASDAWVELPGDGESTTRAFVTVENPTMYDCYLLSATSDAAGKVELRKAEQEDEPTGGLEVTVPAYGSVAAASDGWYLLLSDLKRPLNEGDTVTLTLKTDASPLEVSAVVRPK